MVRKRSGLGLKVLIFTITAAWTQWSGMQNSAVVPLLVSLNLLVTAGKSHVSEVLLLLELVEGVADVHLKVVPAQTKLFTGTHGPELLRSSKL